MWSRRYVTLAAHAGILDSHRQPEYCICPVLQIYDLLMLNYVEDDDAMFRYDLHRTPPTAM